ncbi:MAG TPA: efflux RND transporter periplasmic adaptor subunit [Anaerolineales bacterium]|nr:efflux RND transporter periplasmic adaptor subunit [Anaerolineales bacterium]
MRRVVMIVIVVGVIAGGWYTYNRFQAQNQITSLSDLQTVAIERGELSASVGATGTVRANQTAILAWQITGTVAEVRIAAGEMVSEEDNLAQLKETSLPQTIILAGVELVNAQNDLEKLLEPPSQLELSQAEQAIARVQDALRDAERRVANLNSAAPQPDIDQARSNVVLAENKLEKAREAFEPYANKPEDNLIRAALQSQLAQAQKEYDAAVTRLNNLLGMTNAIDLAVAEADQALAQAQLADAQEQYAELKAGANVNDIAAVEARITVAQATIDLQRIMAPFDGTITEVQVKPGDQIAPGSTAFRLDDLSHLLVDVLVSEVDINNINPGQEATLTFDAILGKEYRGVVQEVALVGTAAQGVVDFTVTVELTNADENVTDSNAVKPGMTAAVNILVNQLEDVLLVPNRAVRVRDGKRIVYILKDGLPQAVEVSLGASSETHSQLLEGDLKAGDLVVLNPPTVFEQNGPPPFVRR